MILKCFYCKIYVLTTMFSAAREIAVVDPLGAVLGVTGVTSMGDELYVLRCACSHAARIDVYSVIDFSFLYRFPVPELDDNDGIRDFTSTDSFSEPFLLAADGEGRCLYKIAKRGKNWPVARWPLPAKPCGVSAVKCGFAERVIAACSTDGRFVSTTARLIELTSQGESIREIILKSPVGSLRSVRALETGDYLVSYKSCSWCNCKGRVGISTVDAGGTVTQSYGDWWWLPWGRELLRGRCHVAVDSDGFVFVADEDRVVLLNPSLEFVRSIATIRRPAWLHLDRKSLRLFVGCKKLFGEVRVFQL